MLLLISSHIMKPNDLSFLLNSSDQSPVASKDVSTFVDNFIASRKRKSISIESLLDTPRKLQKVVTDKTHLPPVTSQAPSIHFSEHHYHPPHHQQYTTQSISLPSPKLQFDDPFNEPNNFLRPRKAHQPPSPLSLSAILASPPPGSPVISPQPVASVLSSNIVPASVPEPESPLITTVAQELPQKSTPSSLTLKIASALRTRLTYAKVKLQNGWESKSLSRIESMNKTNNNNYNNIIITDNFSGSEIYDLDPLRINNCISNFPEPDYSLSTLARFRHTRRSSQSTFSSPRPRYMLRKFSA